MASLQLLLFGAPRLERLNLEDDTAVTVRRRKSLALLAYLVVGDKAQSRDGLATLLWPESDQSSARANLRRDLSRLQKDLGGDILRTERDLIFVKSGAIRCDVADFRQKLSSVAGHQHGEAQDALCP
ncbi:MAG: AfsR/SARP family transcriptional regulator, partial [Chloroflexota bacterium]